MSLEDRIAPLRITTFKPRKDLPGEADETQAAVREKGGPWAGLAATEKVICCLIQNIDKDDLMVNKMGLTSSPSPANMSAMTVVPHPRRHY